MLVTEPLVPREPAQHPGRSWLVVCAWCAQRGRPRASLRVAGVPGRHTVSHAMATALTRAGLASHGVCPQCATALRREWA